MTSCSNKNVIVLADDTLNKTNSVVLMCSIFAVLETSVELVYLNYGNNVERPVDPAFTRLPAQTICAALAVVGETLISLRHSRRASLSEIVRH
ncbi:unnamed protein product [Rotaria magnacalcarata]|uniref:Uncharacterized protein n=2 Tax=Rotaria magnacalcarata TaxID=392030 RepID=A0A820ALF2_9BILA|nr:unnamed protein product [Rotaria magnacalcarata]